MTLITFLADAGSTGVGDVTSFGVAGLMGVMWLWERRNSRKREEQLDESHTRILADRVALEQLIAVVRQNAEALTRLSATQDQLIRQFSGNEVRQ